MKKGQMQEQIFIYILVIVVSAGILFYGYTAIKNFVNRGNEVLLLEFQNDIKHDLQTISYQSTKEKKYELPGSISQVCFKTSDADATDVTCEEIDNNKNYGLIKTAVSSHVEENVFLYPNGERSFFTGITIVLGKRTSGSCAGTGASVKPDYKFKCFNVESGVLTVRITGLGNAVLIS